MFLSRAVSSFQSITEIALVQLRFAGLFEAEHRRLGAASTAAEAPRGLRAGGGVHARDTDEERGGVGAHGHEGLEHLHDTEDALLEIPAVFLYKNQSKKNTYVIGMSTIRYT